MQITLEKFCNMWYNNLTKERWSMWFFKKKNKKVEEKEVEEKNEEVKAEVKEEPEAKEEPKKASSKAKNSNTKSNKNEEKAVKKVTTKKEEKTDTEESAEKEEDKKGSYRVIYSKEDKVWLIKRDGAKRTIASFKTKEQALARVSELCKNQNAKVIVHKKDGKFQKQTKKI